MTFGPRSQVVEDTATSSMQATGASPVLAPTRVRDPGFPEIGVALFDNPKDATIGWACLVDGEPFRFRQPTELSNDVIWVCNFDFNSYFQRGRNAHNLRDSRFFAASLTQIAADHGLGVVGSPAFATSKILAKVVERTVRIVAAAYGWNEPILMLKSNNLMEDIRKHMPRQTPAKQIMKSPLISAFQLNSKPIWVHAPFMPDSLNVSLRYNRLDYARRIMETPIPDLAFNYVPSNVLQGMPQAARLRMALESGSSLVEATIELTSSTDSDTASLISFGTTTGKKDIVRKWMTDLELRWISQFARVTIVSMFRSEAPATTLENSYRLPDAYSQDDLYAMSISAGLAAECHWACLANSIHVANSREFTREMTVIGTWLRAADRAYSFDLARKAHLAGYRIFSYGNGSVALQLERVRLRELLDFAIETGVSYPCFKSLFAEYLADDE